MILTELNWDGMQTPKLNIIQVPVPLIGFCGHGLQHSHRRNSVCFTKIEVNEPHEGKRKNEALWPVFQITWQRSRYVYDMHYVYKAISKDVVEYCIRNVSGPPPGALGIDRKSAFVEV